VRAGLYLAYWPWFAPEEQVTLARRADRAGLDSVWVAEAWGQAVVSVLGHLSAVTERIDLGSGLMQIPARTPAMTAMTAATSPGRGLRSTSAAWAPAGRTSTSRRRSASGRANSRARCSGASSPATARARPRALSPELIDATAICCRPGELGARLAEYADAGANTLLVLPFGDRPAIVDELAAASVAV
jgi:Luciferase-like monooxygenase